MNIPDQAEKRYPVEWGNTGDEVWGRPPLESRERDAFIEGATWARKEALREAAGVAERWGEKNEVGGYTRAAFTVAVAIRALAEGDN